MAVPVVVVDAAGAGAPVAIPGAVVADAEAAVGEVAVVAVLERVVRVEDILLLIVVFFE